MNSSDSQWGSIVAHSRPKRARTNERERGHRLSQDGGTVRIVVVTEDPRSRRRRRRRRRHFDPYRRSRRKNRKRPHARTRTVGRTDGQARRSHTFIVHARARPPALACSMRGSEEQTDEETGPARAGGRAGGPRDHEGITAPRVREHVAGRGGRGVGARRRRGRSVVVVVVDIAVKSGHASRFSAVRPFVHSRMQVIRANGGRESGGDGDGDGE